MPPAEQPRAAGSPAPRTTSAAVVGAWFVDRTPFARITSFSSLVIVFSSSLDGFTADPGRLGQDWVWAWAAVALLVATAPLLLGRRFPRWAGLLATGVFLAVTTLQVATANPDVVAVNNVVLHPMVACYLGWFYSRRTAWTTFLVAVVATSVAVVANDGAGMGTTWVNIVVVSLFCLAAVSYLHRGLERQAATDPLTGALNRAGFTERAVRALASAARSGVPLALALVDLDDFKQVNDRDGHAEGDRVLVELVATVAGGVRPGDAVARLGGDEFAILLPATTLTGAQRLLAELRGVSASSWSCGVALSSPGDTLAALLERADAALYVTKRARDPLPAPRGAGPSVEAVGPARLGIVG